MDNHLVRFDGVHKSFKGKTAIEDLHLYIRRGEAVALCGGNGAGKSTLLRMVAGILRPTRGSISVNGHDWLENRQNYARQIGYMPDDYRFSPGLTAMETMLFWARLRGLGKTRAKEVLSMVGLSDTGSKPVASFSKGMRQRVLFAQALLAEPPLVIMDEPTNGLDPFWMNTFVTLVHQAVSNGQTLLFSTHQLEIAEALADRIVFLRDGNVILDRKREDIHLTNETEGMQQVFRELFGISGGFSRHEDKL
ncbi:ABC-type multidrug transport system, ATPase component [Paenibacillus sp. cl141a]|uniref:ABC transporter ATP-binding protein n=1 Tax=Paenibacillus sp. cl141a TaxID=1761877 RepID=UPI0008CF06FE|nr:ABC transporter ATP-binding protein [Paenibacillus sp. cl141a]SEL96411.1 ABC-type multidrug transport system, ATPase component [Paenibacillus sp. cl141a]